MPSPCIPSRRVASYSWMVFKVVPFEEFGRDASSDRARERYAAARIIRATRIERTIARKRLARAGTDTTSSHSR